MTAEQKKLALVALVLWWLWRREHVDYEIDYPEAPEGQCYDPETQTYYVGDC